MDGTIPTEELCLCCFGSKIIKSPINNLVKPCPLCHGGKITGNELTTVNKNYQTLVDEFAEEEVDDSIHDFMEH